MNWIHRFLNPHCEHCQIEDEKRFQRDSFNPTIELLKDEIERLRRINDNLMSRLDTSTNQIKEVIPEGGLNPVPVKPTNLPWRIKQRELEAEDRNKARVIRRLQDAGIDVDKPLPISDLEKEIEEVKARIENAG